MFAGLDMEDESNLLAFESGDFDSDELSIVSKRYYIKVSLLLS